MRGKPVKAGPKFLGRAVAIFHCRRAGGVSNNACSMSTQRRSSASFIAALNSSGIQESSCSTTNLATAARSVGGSDLICSMISCALMSFVNIRKAASLSKSGLYCRQKICARYSRASLCRCGHPPAAPTVPDRNRYLLLPIRIAGAITPVPQRARSQSSWRALTTPKNSTAYPARPKSRPMPAIRKFCVNM